MYPVIPSSETIAVSAVSAPFVLAMIANRTYLYTCNVDSYIAQGAAPVSVAGAGANRMFVRAGEPMKIRGDHGAKLASIAGGAGFASLTPVQE